MNEKNIDVLRLGHRFVRDDRTVTHLCLVSRALGAQMIVLEEVDSELKNTVDEVNKTWGGDFRVIESSWGKVVEAAKKEGRVVVHLTMYGMPLQEKIEELRKQKNLLVVIGGPKVPGDIYKLADFNISITTQPHSEVAALAIFLHEIQSGEELKKEFREHKLKIIPREKGKQVELKS